MTTGSSDKIEVTLPRDLRLVYWGLLGLGVLIALIGLSQGAGALSFVPGCFLGIAARIVQAEHQHRQTLRAGPAGPQPSENP